LPRGGALLGAAEPWLGRLAIRQGRRRNWHYPWLKLRLNRLAHAFIMFMFGIKLERYDRCLQSYIWLEKYFSRGDYRKQ
jgi:hypothetical protein